MKTTLRTMFFLMPFAVLFTISNAMEDFIDKEKMEYDEKSSAEIIHNSYIDEDFLSLLANGNATAGDLEEAIFNGLNLHAKDDNDNGLLHFAAGHNMINIIKILMKQNLNLYKTNEAENTPLHYAAAHNSDMVIPLLLEFEGADINAKNIDGNTPLQVALECENGRAFQALLEHKANPNVFDAEGSSLLHIAAIKNHLFFTNFLLVYGANPNIPNHLHNGFTALHYAAIANNIPIIKILLPSINDIDVQSTDGLTPLHIATIEGNKKTVELLLQYGAKLDTRDTNGNTPLHSAAQCGHLEIVTMFLNMEMCPNTQNTAGRTPLHFAAASGFTEIATMLIREGADQEIHDIYQKSPLDYAQENKQEDIVSILITCVK